MEKFYYRRLDVYQNAKILAINVNEDLKTFPMEERFGLTNQFGNGNQRQSAKPMDVLRARTAQTPQML